MLEPRPTCFRISNFQPQDFEPEAGRKSKTQVVVVVVVAAVSDRGRFLSGPV